MDNPVELTKAQISVLRRQVEQENSSFKEKRYLESLSAPSFIQGRNKEAKKLLELLLRIKDGYLPPFVSVVGRSGTGKSTVTKQVCEKISDTISYSIIDLRRANTQFTWLNLILEGPDLESVKPHEGIRKELFQMEQRITEILKGYCVNKNFFKTRFCQLVEFINNMLIPKNIKWPFLILKQFYR